MALVMTSLLDSPLYSVAVAVLLASLFVFSRARTEVLAQNFTTAIQEWLSDSKKIEDSKHLVGILDSTPESKTSLPNYPNTWWTNEDQFQLERRAIFSKAWFFVSHKSRFQKAGDYRTFEIAGFSFLVILGKDQQLRAFHNVCRHRAYAVTKKESGSSTVLGCRYHGWSYDTRGKLVKAPEFDKVAGFDREMNGLWELKIEVCEGMVFVNFHVGGSLILDLRSSEKALQRWDMTNLKWAHEWKLEGEFNWKLAAIASPFDIDGFQRVLNSDWTLGNLLRRTEKAFELSHASFVRQLPSGLLTINFLPLSPRKTLVECNVYKKSLRYTKTTQAELDQVKQETLSMIQRMERKQRTLADGSGQIQDTEFSRYEKLEKLLEYHGREEMRLGAEIHPAARKQSFTPEGVADDDLCKELEIGSSTVVCGANAKKLLDW